MGTRRVVNLGTTDEILYVGCTERQAVMAAYAQREHKDWNTWDYETKYGHMVTTGKASVACGDWATLKDNK